MEKLLESHQTLLNLITQLRFLAALCDTANDVELGLKQIQVKNFFRKVSVSKSVNDMSINYGLIIACSLLDEYNQRFTIGVVPELSERVLRLKQMTKPIFQRLKRWPDLKDYRNYMLAHNFRIKDQSFFSADLTSISYAVPNSYNEFKFLTELLTILVKCVSDQFPDLYAQINTESRMDEKISLPAQEINIEEEIAKLMEEIQPFMHKN